MKNTLSTLIFCAIALMCQSQIIYVDSNNGNDSNPGTIDAPVYSLHKAIDFVNSENNGVYVIKINPGIYVLEKPLEIKSIKPLSKEKRIVFESSILPGDSLWTPEMMPVIINRSKKGSVTYHQQHVVSFQIEVSHITIRGLKFSGYFYPNTKYFPIYRLNKEKTDLTVDQCMFVGDDQASVIQVGVIAHGSEVKVNRCIFHNVRNAVVFWLAPANEEKFGNSFTNCIVDGVSEGAVWTCSQEKDFIFENNIVTRSKYAWLINTGNPTKYKIKNSFIVDNEFYKGNWELKEDDFHLEETDVIKNGQVRLRYLSSIDDTMPIDYLHVLPNSDGYKIGAGILIHKP